MPNKDEAVAVRVYAGGFTLGARRAGWRVTHHVEDSPPYARRTAEANLGVTVLPLASDPAAAADEIRSRGLAPSLVYGNPPCAPFSPQGSRAGSQGRWRMDPRCAHTSTLVDFALEVGDVDAVVWESVPASWGQGRDFEAAQLRRLADAGLNCHVVHHDASRVGLPQRRRRVFYVATAGAFRPAPPTPLSTNVWDVGFEMQRAYAVSCALGDDRGLRRITPSVAECLPDVPPGGKVLGAWRGRHPDGAPGKPSVVCRRLAWDQPSPAITGTYAYVHPDEDRCITVEEAQVLCGFPADWRFQCTPRQAALELARGVMPTVAAWVLAGVRAGLHAPGGDPADGLTIHAYPDEEGTVERIVEPWNTYPS